MIKFYLFILCISLFVQKSEAQCADSLTISSNNSICIGDSVTLTAILHGSNVANSVIYSWSPGGQNTPSIIVAPNTTTTYSCTVLINTCSNLIKSKTIFVTTLPTVNAGVNQTVCAGTAVTLSGSGATTYAWNNGVNNAVAFIPTTTTTYTVTGTDANGCSNTAQATVTVNAAPSVSAGSNQTVCAGTAVTLSGSGATTYAWNNSVNNAVAFTPTSTATYTVIGTDANGCSNTAQATVTVVAAPIVSAGNQTVCAGTAVTLSGSGATTYVWNNGVSNAVAFTPTTTTTYTVIGTAANGCSNTAQATVTVVAAPIVSAGNQTVCSGTAVTLSGSGATTYVWNNGVSNAVAFTPTTTTTYTVIGTAANGCSNTAQATVTVNAAPSVSAGSNQTVCAGTAVTLSGTGATTYAWNNGVNNAVAFIPTTTTTYTVTGTDANGCSNTAQVTVTVNAAPSVSAGSNQTVCAGTAVTLSGSGATTYAWNNGVNNAVAFTPTSTNTYTVTGTDANGCSNTAQATVTVNAAPIVSAGNQTVCAGTAVTLSGSGATTYVWNNGVNNAVAFTPTTTTTYTVTGTAANGCSNTAQVTVTVNAVPSVSAGSNQTICAGTAVTLSGSGATTYAWNNGVNNAVAFTPTSTNTYTVTGTNTNGCINTAQVTVTVNAAPSVSAGSNQTVCAGTAVTLSGSGATTYAWNNSVNNAVAFTPTSTATYTVTGTNSSTGCSNTDQVLITINSVPISDAGNNQLICLGNEAILNGNIGGSATTATWEGGNGTFTPNNTNLNASYLPSLDEIEAGYVVLTLTTNDPDGPCSAAENQMTISISPNIGNTTGPVTNLCQNSSWNLYENDCEDCYISWEAVGGIIQGYTSTNGAYVQWDNAVSTPYLVLTITNPSTGCVANDSLFPTFSSNTAPISQEVLLIDPNFNLLGLNQTNYNIYTWGYSLKNQFSTYDIVSQGNPYASYPAIDTLNFDYWVEYGELTQCLTRSYYNQPGFLGIETSSENSVFIYPNPFSEHIIVDNIVGESKVRVFNSVGALVVNTTISPSNNLIQTSHLQDGMYFVNLDQKNKSTVIFKLIKN